MDATYVTIDTRPVLSFERRLAHPIDAVWRAISEPEQLEHWFPTSVALDPRVGGAMTFTFREHTLPDGSSTMLGEVNELDPPRRFGFAWGEDQLKFELEPIEGGAATHLRFTVVLGTEDKAARDGAGWTVCLARLERQLAGGPTAAPGPEPTGEWREHYEDYIRRGFPSGAPVPGA